MKGHIVDIVSEKIFDGEIIIENGKIASIKPCEVPSDAPYFMPGFVDAHMHIESTMVMPDELARAVVKFGTVAVVCDPHEIANVCGKEGFHFMRDNASTVPFIFRFGVPSCVPATPFETSGATLDADDVRELLQYDDVFGLAEMMNYPGVIGNDPGTMDKIKATLEMGKVVDGHSPGLSGDALTRYIDAGISTDHECVTYEEGLERIMKGMHVIIRQSPAECNHNALSPLIKDHSDMTMFCTDDLDPAEFEIGHINKHTRMCVNSTDLHLWNVLRTATVNAMKHYGLDLAQLQVGDTATFIAVEDLREFKVLGTWIGGKEVWSIENGYCEEFKPHRPADLKLPNRFCAKPLSVEDLAVECDGSPLKVISVTDGSVVTESVVMEPKVVDGKAVGDTERDMLKYVVYSRYQEDGPSAPAVAFIKGFGLKKGALASSVAHDSHNICAVGTSDEEIVAAVNLLIENKGGLVAVDGDRKEIMPLPVAGLMSDRPAKEVGEKHTKMIEFAKALGSPLKVPYMTMSFMSLPVIPKLKLTNKGLFDVTAFSFTDLKA